MKKFGFLFLLLKSSKSSSTLCCLAFIQLLSLVLSFPSYANTVSQGRSSNELSTEISDLSQPVQEKQSQDLQLNGSLQQGENPGESDVKADITILETQAEEPVLAQEPGQPEATPPEEPEVSPVGDPLDK
ncbi:MAG: hypothetical protein WA902_05830, partial [Thermosynechococcaceae cyanobacterium]